MDRLLRARGRHSSSLRAWSVRRSNNSAWICPSRVAGQARFKSSDSPPSTIRDSTVKPLNKPYYVTTPIFYVNSTPHIGHLYSMVVADVFKRWHALKGYEAYLSTGTDEHGLKIQQAAAQQGVTPKELCDANAESFKDLARKANISHDFFIRTTEAEHRDAVEAFWNRLRESGYVYETSHSGWYCVSDECFYPENSLITRVDKATGRKYPASGETGNEVEWTTERNYHFKLTAFRERLLDFYQMHKQWVEPFVRFNDIQDWVKNHLEDLSISRPANRLSWGIPVPGDETQTIYVWLDALVNYLTVAGYPNWKERLPSNGWPSGDVQTGMWPADVHVVGKDIMRFHCVYWPAFLMALDLPLPKQVLSHGHWLMGKAKMSKSIGNVVNPFFALERWGVDTLRFYLMYNGKQAFDSNYDNATIDGQYRKVLLGGLGNLLNRVTRPKLWSLREIVKTMHGDPDRRLLDDVERTKSDIYHSNERINGSMTALNPRGSLERIFQIIFKVNKMYQRASPWLLAEQLLVEEEEGVRDQMEQTIYYTAETLRISGIMLQAFIPGKASEVLDRLGVSPDRRTMKYATLHMDGTYGTPLVPVGEGAHDSVFPPYPVED